MRSQHPGVKSSEHRKIFDWNSVVTVAHFTRQKEGNEVIIGRPNSATFFAVSPGVVDILDHLASGKSVGETVALYRAYHGEACDINDLLTVLEAKGIVAWPDAEEGSGDTHKADPHKRYHLANFPQALARRIFQPSIIGMELIVILIGIVIIVQNRSLWPSPNDIYFTSQRTLKLMLLSILSYGGVLLHELAHLVAARAVGVKSRISIGNRLYELVIEADLTGLWSVPKRMRYLPFMAGCLVDAFSAAALVTWLYARQKGWIGLSGATPFVRMALLSYGVRIAWQGLIFVRTDFYYVIVAWLNCRNLLGDTETYLQNQVARVVKAIRTVDQSDIPIAERRIIRVYAAIWIAGRLAALYGLCAVAAPLIYRYAADAGRSLGNYSRDRGGFWDALFLVLSFGLPIFIGCLLWVGDLISSHFLAKRIFSHE
jgi:putative peptide zinc metalloprotease protein